MSETSRTTRSPLWISLLVLVGFLVGVYVGYTFSPQVDTDGGPTPSSVTSETGQTSAGSDAVLADLFERQVSDVQVTGNGVVTRILPDDLEGSRHQKFIVTLGTGQTILIAHNIDVAPRLEGLKEGQQVSFYGEYVYSEQGGTIHWTHHDPAGKHEAGWLQWNGRTYG
ncbi:MAG: DUF3465 domain-containing protein [Propionibacteriaceae bacterium]|nr:DUF3465 domain-containing protein [Propionibacteriaceae bacterium]